MAVSVSLTFLTPLVFPLSHLFRPPPLILALTLSPFVSSLSLSLIHLADYIAHSILLYIFIHVLFPALTLATPTAALSRRSDT